MKKPVNLLLSFQADMLQNLFMNRFFQRIDIPEI